MKIAFLDSAHPSLRLNLEKSGFECIDFNDIHKENAAGLLQDVSGIIIRSRFVIDSALIDALPKLKFIARVGAGMENIDWKYGESKGVRCLNAPEGNRNAVAEQALGMLLALMNNLVKADREVRAGKWIREGNRGYELSGKTIGIVGYGNTGQAFAKILRGFDVELLVYDKYLADYGDSFAIRSDMDSIFSKADIVSLHLPLTEETTYLVGRDFINQFRKPFYLINTSRGRCVKTADLVEGLKNEKIRGAALDVLEFESVSFEHIGEIPPALDYLLHSDQVVLSPHIAGWTHESHQKMADILYHKIMGLFQ